MLSLRILCLEGGERKGEYHDNRAVFTEFPEILSILDVEAHPWS